MNDRMPVQVTGPTSTGDIGIYVVGEVGVTEDHVITPRQALGLAVELLKEVDTVWAEDRKRSVTGWRWACGSCGLEMLVNKQPSKSGTCPACPNPDALEVAWEHTEWTT